MSVVLGLFFSQLSRTTFWETPQSWAHLSSGQFGCIGSALPWQVPKEYHSGQDLGGQKGADEASAAWIERARTFLKRSRGDPDSADAPPPARKKRRVKTYSLMLMIDNMVRNHIGAGKGLEVFRVEADEQGTLPSPYSWRHLSVTSDQGSDNVCAVGYLKHLGLNLQEWYDPSHGAWNDGKLALKDTQLWCHQLLMMGAMNVSYGSTFAPPRLQQLREGAQEYLENTNPNDCPVFLENLQQLLLEQGQGILPTDVGAVEVEGSGGGECARGAFVESSRRAAPNKGGRPAMFWPLAWRLAPIPPSHTARLHGRSSGRPRLSSARARR